MAKDLRLVILLDFYGGLLTDKQAAALDMYYNQDLSLSEIAEEMGISRQGVMAFLKQGEKHLRGFENKLGLAGRFQRVSEGLGKMRAVLKGMPDNDERRMLEMLAAEISDVI